MNKTRIFLLAAVCTALTAGAVAFIATRGSGDAYLNSLPKEVNALARLDSKELIAEADLSLRDVLKILSRSQDSDDNVRLGINMKQPVYGFVSTSGNFGLTAAVKSEKDLTAFCESLNAKGQASELTSQRGYSWVVVQQQWLLAFDSKKALAMGPAVGAAQDQLRAEMAQLLEQDKADSGRESELFTALKNREEPLAAIVAPEILPANAKNTLRKLKVASRADALLCLALEADDNELELETQVLAQSDQVKEQLKSINEFLRPIKGTMIEHAHAENVAWMAMNVQGQELLETLRSNESVRAALLIMNFIIDLDRIISSVDGDVAVELTDASSLKSGQVDASQLKNLYLTAQVANTDFLAGAASWGNKLVGVQTLSEKDFAVNLGNASMYFGVDDKIFYLGAQQGLPSGKNEYLREESRDIKGARFFATFAIPTLLEQTGIASQLPFSLPSFERLNLEMEDAGEFHLTLVAPKGTNIIQEILLAE